MIALTGVPILSKIYGRSTLLVCPGRSEQDNRSNIVKLLKQDYPSSHKLICDRQEYEITRSRPIAALDSNGQRIIDASSEIELSIGKQPIVPEVGAIETPTCLNRVFGRLIQVFCSNGHLLMLFLNDLQ